MILAAKGFGGGIPLGGGAAAVEQVGGGDGDPVEEIVERGTPALALSPLGRRAGGRRGFFDFESKMVGSTRRKQHWQLLI